MITWAAVEEAFAWGNLWLAIPLQLVGFGIAIAQVRAARSESTKAKEAAEAASVAADRTRRQMHRDAASFLLPQLQQAEAELDYWMQRGDLSGVVRSLNAWRWQAAQLLSHRLSLRLDEDLADALELAIRHAGEAKNALDEPAASIVRRTREARQAITDVTGRLGDPILGLSSEATLDPTEQVANLTSNAADDGGRAAGRRQVDEQRTA